MVRRDVEAQRTKIVMIDSISGYRLSVSDEELNERLHALCRYLQNVGVTVLLINELLNIAEFRITRYRHHLSRRQRDDAALHRAPQRVARRDRAASSACSRSG